MSIKGYTGQAYYATIITVTAGTGYTASWTGLANLRISAERGVTLYKPLDNNAPVKVPGKLDGKIQLQGFIVNEQMSAIVAVNDQLTASPPARVEFTLVNGSASQTYAGYLTGRGITFRQISDRLHVMDGVDIISIIE